MSKPPYELNTHRVRQLVDRGRHGVYKLYDSSYGPPHYVGRSAKKRLAERLLRHARKGIYSHFEHEYKNSKTKAFERECGLWHYHKEKLDNDEHPRRPDGIKNISCPMCNFPADWPSK